MQTTLLIDADGLVYWAGYGRQEVFNWGDGVVSEDGNILRAQDTIREALDAWVDSLLADAVVLCLSDSSRRYFRHDLLSTYKHNRKGTKPMLYHELRAWMKDTYPTYERPGLEADDVCGILSTSPVVIPGRKIVVSVDKDMKSVPGYLYNPNRPDQGVRQIHPLEADYWHLYQTLTGDSTDGYSGCWRIGPVVAEQVLKGCVHESVPFRTRSEIMARRWGAVVGMFRTQHRKYNIDLDPAETALTQARVARILRREDYDYSNRRVIPWTPESIK